MYARIVTRRRQELPFMLRNIGARRIGGTLFHYPMIGVAVWNGGRDRAKIKAENQSLPPANVLKR